MGLDLIAITAGTAHLYNGTDDMKTCGLSRLADIAGQAVIIDMGGSAASVADQENTVVQAARMRIGKISVRAFDTAGKIVRYKQIEDPVNTVRRDPLSAFLRNKVCNIIGRRRLFKGGKHCKNIGTHVGPLFASGGQGKFGRLCKIRPMMFVMIM